MNNNSITHPICKNDKIGIIGGKGAMGQWLCTFFESFGYNIKISDIDTELSNKEIAAMCRVVILSTPIKEAIKISESIGRILKPNQVLMDICSQKEDILDAMLKNSVSDVIGTHPMFGPTITSIKNQNIVVCRGRGNIGYSWVKKIFSKKGGNVKILKADDHDRTMAVVQSLTHFLTISFAKMLKTMDIHPKNIFDISTPIFKINADLIGRLFAQDPELYATLVGSNKYADQCLKIFSQSFQETKEKLMSGSLKEASNYIKDTGAFLDKPLHKYRGNYKQEAMDRSNKFLNIIFE
jgi:prephenate dehydrogenase